MFKTQIQIDDMYDRDERALKILRDSKNPQTNESALTLTELADRLRCHRNTARAITDRLVGMGKIRKIKAKGRGGSLIEVLCSE